MAETLSKKIIELDCLRGIASFIVLAGHCSLVWPEAMHATVPLWVSFSPIRLLLSGYASVILFFTLSGYVLTLPYLRHTDLKYPAYLIKRICRIYIPFACAIFMAALLYHNLSPLAGNEGSDWFRNLWPPGDINTSNIINHLTMTGLDPDMWLDAVMWSLVYELRISILFPLLRMLGKNLRNGLIIAVTLYIAACAAAIMTGNDWSLRSANDLFGTFILTARFIPYFIIGTTLAQHNPPIEKWLNDMPRKLWLVLIVTALIAITLPTEIYNERLKNMLPVLNNTSALKYLIEFFYGIASGFIIISARNVQSLSTIVTIAPLRWLGKVSYSLYLVHLPIALFLFHALLGKIAFGYSVLIVICVSLLSAHIFNKYVEAPATRLGQMIAKKIT